MAPVLALAAALLLGSSAAAAAAADPAPTASASPPTANPADVSTPEAVVRAVYATISGPAGAPRDWARFRSLMAPEARFVVVGASPDGRVRRRVLSIEAYIAQAGAVFSREGFWEHGVVPQGAGWAHIATIVSPYESRHAEGETPFARGVNQIELTSDGTRWYIEDIVFEGETPANPLTPDAVAALHRR